MIETIKKDIDFAIENYNDPKNREAVYSALHRIQMAVTPKDINQTDDSGD